MRVRVALARVALARVAGVMGMAVWGAVRVALTEEMMAATMAEGVKVVEMTAEAAKAGAMMEEGVRAGLMAGVTVRVGVRAPAAAGVGWEGVKEVARAAVRVGGRRRQWRQSPHSCSQDRRPSPLAVEALLRTCC